MMATTFPRERNGHVDTGLQIASIQGKTCPNCGSTRYRETLSTEDCIDCGLHCDYWGGGANSVYEEMLVADEVAQQKALQEAEEPVN
jgi:hypothetical protein